MKIKAITLLVIIGLLLAACQNDGSGGPTISSTQADPVAPESVTVEPVQPTAAALTAAPTESEPAPTVAVPDETISPTDTVAAPDSSVDVIAALQEIIQNEAWASLGMDADQAARWESYARNQGALTSEEELAYLQNFVSQWQLLNTAAEQAVVPDDAQPAFRVMILDHETGGPEPVLYALAVDSEAPKGSEQLFLIARDRKDQPVGLLAAPVIAGTRQQISPDGQHVEYFDAERNIERLYADARKLSTGRQSEEILLEMLEAPYSSMHPYNRSGLYPLYHFPIPGVDASFYTLESLLTYPQIVQMYEAFQLLDRPEFAPLKNAIFEKSTSVTIIEVSSVYLGVTYLGTGVMQLNRKDLLGNKYELVGVLVHEGAHILQSWSSGGDACKNSLRREIGNRDVPDDFFAWDAEQVLEGIKAQRIGAYHAGFWVWQKLGVLDDFWPSWREVIRTGKIGARWISGNCP